VKVAEAHLVSKLLEQNASATYQRDAGNGGCFLNDIPQTESIHLSV
jgi:hypothetical protein